MNLNRLTLSVMVVCLLAPVGTLRAESETLAARRTQLHNATTILESISDENYLKVSREQSSGELPFKTRYKALEALYKNLAALEYREAMAGGLAGRELGRAEVSQERILEDAQRFAIDPETLENTGFFSAFVKYLNESTNQTYYRNRPSRGPAVFAVRGGRKVHTKTDREIAKINKSLETVSRDFKKDLSSGKKAQLHYKAGRIYEKLAKTVSGNNIPAEDVTLDQLKEAAASLRKISEDIRSGDQDVQYRQTGGDAPDAEDAARPRHLTRAAALGLLYRELATIEYNVSLKTGLSERKQRKVTESIERLEKEKQLALNDAELIMSDQDSAMTVGCSTSCCYEKYVYGKGNVCTCFCRAGRKLGVKAGRRISSKAALKLAKLDRSLTKVSRGLGGDSKKDASLHYKSARIYEKMAAAVTIARPRTSEAADLSAKQIYKNAGPAVVLLVCSDPDGSGELGTGSVIEADGSILTNAHVVVRDSTGKPFKNIRIYFKPKRITGDPRRDMTHPRKGRVVSWDSDLDLALLELEDKPADLKVLPLGDSDAMETGDPVVAIGHPEQGGLWTLTKGVISTILADHGNVAGKDVFQTDTSINRGNSGGPLLDRRGALIGVNTSMARMAADGLAITSVNFAIKSSVVKSWLSSIGRDTAAAVSGTDKPAPVTPKPAPVVPAPAPVFPPPTRPAKINIVTPKKPFSINDLLKREISAMEDMEKQMQREIESRRKQPR